MLLGIMLRVLTCHNPQGQGTHRARNIIPVMRIDGIMVTLTPDPQKAKTPLSMRGFTNKKPISQSLPFSFRYCL